MTAPTTEKLRELLARPRRPLAKGGRVMNRVESLKQIFPSQKSIADICGVHPVSVTGWKRRDWIPAAHHTRLRAALSGLVRTQFLTDERAQELSRILDAALSGECPHCGAVRR